jgi:soluble lytic murein transglycosylase-like protein
MQAALRFVSSFVLVFSLTTSLSANSFASGSKAGHDKRFSSLIAQHARANGIPVELARAVVKHESGFNAAATGRAGEIGLMQIKLSTARGLGYKGSAKGLYDPATNLRWGMKYLGQAKKLAGGSECGTLSRYNGGHGTKRMIRGYCSKVIKAKAN